MFQSEQKICTCHYTEFNVRNPFKNVDQDSQDFTVYGDTDSSQLTVDPQTRGLIFSFFSGSGFLDLGFEREGFTSMLVNEFYGPFLAAYKHNRLKMGMSAPAFGYVQGSIENLCRGKGKVWFERQIATARKLGKPIGFIGGPPCPDFSNAGKHAGKAGKNGRLTRVYIDLIRTHKPDFFVFENVKGLMEIHADHLLELENLLGKAGYRFGVRLANALEYGVPQSRERVVIVGFHKRMFEQAGVPMPRKKLLGDGLWEEELRFKIEDIKKLPWPRSIPFVEGSRLAQPKGILRALTVQHWFNKNQVERHPNAQKRFQPRQGLPRMQEVFEGDISRKSFKRLHRWRYSATAAYGNSEVHLHPSQIRRLSAAEALAIQSMPKEFELPDDMSLTDMFKTIGNGVPFLMAEGIAKSVKRQLELLQPIVVPVSKEGRRKQVGRLSTTPHDAGKKRSPIGNKPCDLEGLDIAALAETQRTVVSKQGSRRKF